MAKRVLPHHEADIEIIAAEYLEKWESREDATLASNDGTALMDETWEEAGDSAALTDEKWEESRHGDADHTEENTVQDIQGPLSSSEMSSQSLDENNKAMHVDSELTK